MKPRRAVALLVTLAALVLTAAGAASIAMHASSLSLAQRADGHRRRADDLALAAEAAVLNWLHAEADDVVLPPDAPVPMVDVLSDAWRAGDDDCSVTITAWDQFAMVPLEAVRSGSPLRLALDPSILSAVDGIEPAERGGLDQLACSIERPVLPTSGSPAIGALVATHNPLSRRPEPVAINVNTAPQRLLEIAMRAAGSLDLDLVLAARSEGRPAPTVQTVHPDAMAPMLVAASDCWSVRVDASVGMARRSWWSVWTRERGQWSLSQRILMRE